MYSLLSSIYSLIALCISLFYFRNLTMLFIYPFLLFILFQLSIPQLPLSSLSVFSYIPSIIPPLLFSLIIIFTRLCYLYSSSYCILSRFLFNLLCLPLFLSSQKEDQTSLEGGVFFYIL